MPHIIDSIKAATEKGELTYSLEYFSPKTDAGFDKLYEKWGKLKSHPKQPTFMDVTWGAGGTTADGTTKLCRKGQGEFGYEMNMHLTCTNMPKERLDQALADCKEMGVTNIVALRGDPPQNQAEWTPVESGFTCGLELVEYIRKNHGNHFGISVAGYPEGHPNVIKKVDRELTESEKSRVCMVDGEPHVCSDEDFVKELEYLKKKVDAGADFIITQLFFDAETFRLFVLACRKMGIEVPILPGIMPILSAGGFGRMTSMCKTRVPEDLRAKVDELKEDAPGLARFACEYLSNMVKQILAFQDIKVPGIHMYALNNDGLPHDILAAVGLM